MPYTEDKTVDGLEEITSAASTDVFVVGDQSDLDRAKKITKANLVADLESAMSHDNMTDFDLNEHINHTSVSITAGDGLSGGGDISSTRTINIDINGSTDLASPDGADEILISDASNSNAIRKTDLTTAVNAAGATMNSEADVSGTSWVIDEDEMSSDSATKVTTQQSVKEYVDDELNNAKKDFGVGKT